MQLFLLSWFVLKDLTTFCSSKGGDRKAPVFRKPFSCRYFPESCWMTPPWAPSGMLTTTSPSRTSAAGDGIPPPIPTIRMNLRFGKALYMWDAAESAGLVPAETRPVKTILWSPIRPNEYLFVSRESRRILLSWYFSSSIALLAANSVCNAQIHPTVNRAGSIFAW